MTHLGPSLRRQRVRERPVRRAAAAAVASLLLNALGALVLVRSGTFELATPAGAARPVALAPIQPGQWEANRTITPEAPRGRAADRPLPLADAPPRPSEPSRPPPEPEKVSGQVVDLAPSRDQRRPPDARFLAEHDSTVEKETRSRFAGTRLWENTLPAPSRGPRPPPRPTGGGERGTSDRSTPGPHRITVGEEASGPRGTGSDRLLLPHQPGRERLALAPRGGDRGEEPAVGSREAVPRLPGSGPALEVPGQPPVAPVGGERRAGAYGPLVPTADSLDRILGGPSPDRLQGIEEGDATALDAREFKHAWFFNRVKRAIAERWNPQAAYDARDPEREAFTVRDRLTTIRVELDLSGRVQRLQLAHSSGLDFLDREAMRAIREAAPFPNPPLALADPDGAIRFPFDFELGVSRGAGVVIVGPPGSLDSPFERSYPVRDPANPR